MSKPSRQLISANSRFTLPFHHSLHQRDSIELPDQSQQAQASLLSKSAGSRFERHWSKAAAIACFRLLVNEKANCTKKAFLLTIACGRMLSRSFCSLPWLKVFLICIHYARFIVISPVYILHHISLCIPYPHGGTVE